MAEESQYCNSRERYMRLEQRVWAGSPACGLQWETFRFHGIEETIIGIAVESVMEAWTCWQFPDCSFEWPKCASQSTITENMAWPMCRSKASLLKLSAKKQEQMKNQEVPKHKYKNGWRIAILRQPRALYEARTKGLSRQSSLWPTMGNVSISRYWRNNHRNRCRKRHGSLNGKKHRNEKPFRRWIYKIQEI